MKLAARIDTEAVWQIEISEDDVERVGLQSSNPVRERLSYHNLVVGRTDLTEVNLEQLSIRLAVFDKQNSNAWVGLHGLAPDPDDDDDQVAFRESSSAGTNRHRLNSAAKTDEDTYPETCRHSL